MDSAPHGTLVFPTLACAFRAGCIVYVGGRAMSPSDADWTRYMSFIEEHTVKGQEARALILERGFGPTLGQRQRLHAVTAELKVRAAILTSSAFARGITVMVALAKPGYKAFPLDALDGALAHLGIAAEHGRELGELLRSLEAKVERGRGQPPPSSQY